MAILFSLFFWFLNNLETRKIKKKVLPTFTRSGWGKILIHKCFCLLPHPLLVKVGNTFFFIFLVSKLFFDFLYCLIFTKKRINNTIPLIYLIIDKLSSQIIFILNLKMLNHRILITVSNPLLEIDIFLINFWFLDFLNNLMPILFQYYIFCIYWIFLLRSLSPKSFFMLLPR